MLVAVPGLVSAWSQEVNNYPSAPVSCDGSATWPCIEWPTSGGLSVNVDVYLDSSLTIISTVDFKTDVRNTFSQWNGIAARNPHLQETTSTSNDEEFVHAGQLALTTYGSTSTTYHSTSPYRIISCDTVFNTYISWNHSMDYSSFQLPSGETRYRADSRKVATHELGHCEGLGHTGFAAIMKQGAVSFVTVQSNDIAGIIAVYGAYP